MGAINLTIMYIESSSLDPSCYVVDLPNAKNCDVLRQRKVLHVLDLHVYHTEPIGQLCNFTTALFCDVSRMSRVEVSALSKAFFYRSSFTFIFLRNNNEQAPLTSKLLSTEHTLNHHERNLRKDESSLNHERAAVHQRRRHW